MKNLVKVIVISFLFVAQYSVAAPPALKDFAQLPDVQDVVLSPDGKKLASVVRVDLPNQKGLAVKVLEFKTNKTKVVLFSEAEDYVIYDLDWKDNITLLAHGFSPKTLEYRGFTNMYSYKTRVTRVLFVNTETEEVTHPFTNTFLTKFKAPPSSLNNVVDLLPDDPKHILIRVYGTVYKVNIKTGASSALDGQPKNYSTPYVDRQHRLRMGYYLDGKTFTIKYLDIKDEKWKDLASFDGVFSQDDIDILGFDHDPNIVYIRAYHGDKKAIFKLDLADPNFKRTLVRKNDDYDQYGRILYSRKFKKVMGIIGADSLDTEFYDETLASVQKSINKALPNTKNHFYSFTDDFDKFLVYSSGGVESGTYYLVTTSPLKVEALAYRYQNLPPDNLSTVEKVTYKTRDGLEIEGFLTLPKGVKAKNLPTIMHPHGGPISQDTDAFDYWSQFFASKGYAVLQMNFRGSSGYGFAHRQAGLANWGKEMQDDIEDGAKYLIERGIANKDKIAIVGASYGGYAALMGAVKTPDLYKCAISVAGVSDVRQLVLDNRRFWRSYNVVDEQIGTGAKFLKRISPVNHAKKIKVPILLVHGELDQQVDVEHSEKMYKALKKYNKNVKYVELPDEDHFLSIEANRVKTFEEMNSFLDGCL